MEETMLVQPVVGLYGVLEKSEEGWEDADSTINEVEQQLKAGGLSVKKAPELVVDDASAEKAARSFAKENPDLLVAVVITWSFDHLSFRILQTVSRPLAILAIPGLRSGSIVGAHQLGSLLTDLGMERAVFYRDVDDGETYRSVLAYARAVAVKKRLDNGKIAFIGRRTPGMTPIAFDELEMMRTFGCQVLSYGWEEIHELVKDIDNFRIEVGVEELRRQAGSVASSDESLKEVVALYLALKELGKSEGIIAYGLGCYPHLAGTACVVTGLLSEDGLPAACEGDLNSGLLMYLIQALTGEPAHFGEILDIDKEANTILTSHCGCAAPSLAAKPDDIALVPVRIWERGVCIRFPAKAAAEVSFINLVGRKDSYRLCVSTGSAVETGMEFEGNPVRFKPDCSWQRLLQIIDEHGFGHHWMMGYRNISKELRFFCKHISIKGVFLEANDR